VTGKDDDMRALETDAKVLALRVAQMSFVPRLPRHPISPELLVQRANDAEAKLARIDELLQQELKRHRTLLKRLRTMRRKAHARCRYYRGKRSGA
jgi:hypothetical protein